MLGQEKTHLRRFPNAEMYAQITEMHISECLSVKRKSVTFAYEHWLVIHTIFDYSN